MDAKVTGLQPGTTYHFRVVATNNFGARPSTNVTFTTLLNPVSYRAWQVANAVGADREDDDRDGVFNLLEYAFGLNAKNPGDGRLLPKPELIGNTWRMRYAKTSNVSGITYSAEWSNNLVNWYPCHTYETTTEYDFRTPPNAGAGGKLFSRWVINRTDE
jgi:hypothetical protein